MPTEPMPFGTDDLVRRYVSGESVKTLAEAFRISQRTVSARLRAAGVEIRPPVARKGEEAVSIDTEALVARYLAGESEKALAEAFGVSRTAIRPRLLSAGVQPRGRSEGMYARMARTSPEERSRLADAAHDAVRGKAKTDDFLRERALGVERAGADWGNASAAEAMFGRMLCDAGHAVIHQKAVGPYNVDLATGSVAVEVLGGGWHRSKLHGERLRYILDAGWDVVYIWVEARRFPLAGGAAEYVIAHLEFRDRNPAAPRCYRVVRGGGEFIAKGGADGDDLPDILPISNRPDAPAEVPYGFCRCGCGRRTNIAAETSTRDGYIAGEPRKYLGLGHGVRIAGQPPGAVSRHAR